MGEESLRSFSTYDFLTLDAIARDLPLTEPMRACLPGLVELGAVETHGRGRGTRYLLSRDLHEALDKKGAYTRKRSLDHETNKALLLKHLGDNTTNGAPLAELCQVLPHLSISSVRRLLRELRTEGKVLVKGTLKAARWHRVL